MKVLTQTTLNVLMILLIIAALIISIISLKKDDKTETIIDYSSVSNKMTKDGFIGGIRVRLEGPYELGKKVMGAEHLITENNDVYNCDFNTYKLNKINANPNKTNFTLQFITTTYSNTDSLVSTPVTINGDSFSDGCFATIINDSIETGLRNVGVMDMQGFSKGMMNITFPKNEPINIVCNDCGTIDCIDSLVTFS